jgi:outer membrane protein OmpA-like peptidoglycan-associated protein
LSEGTAAIEGDVYTLSGRGPDGHAACEALRVQIAQQDGPDSVARVAIDCPPAPPPDPEIPPLPKVPGLILNDVAAQAVPVRPYELSLSADRSGVRITGSLPDEAARAMLRAVIADSPLAGKVEDEAVAAPGAPAGFIEAARVVLADLLRLDIGSATIRDREVSLRGLTCRDLIASEVETSEKIGLPPDFTASVSVSPRQTGCVLDPPASCQNDLDGLTKENPVLFAQGTAAVKLDPTTERVIAAAAAILQKCPGAQVMIEGHANRDGEWRAFDNRELSLRRAQRVREELARRGIDPASLVVKGYGTARPLLPHGAPQAREMNRRVQFTIAK